MRIKALIVALLLCQVMPAHSSSGWSGKTVQYLQPDGTNADCYYFTLNGVSQADPVNPGSPWFGVSRTAHPGAKELFAVLLAARLTGTPINVNTTGSLECGYAGVYYTLM